VAETTPLVTICYCYCVGDGVVTAVPVEVATETLTSRIGAPRSIELLAKACVCFYLTYSRASASLFGSLIS